MSNRIAIIGCVFYAALFLSYAYGSDEAGTNIQIVEQNASGLIFEIHFDSLTIVPERSSEGVKNVLSMPNLGYTSELGRPRLPAGFATIGVPPEGEISLQVLHVDYYEKSLANIEKVEAIAEDDYDGGLAIRAPESAAATAWYPEQFAAHGINGYIREQRITRIVFYPVRYHEQSQRVKIARSMRLAVSFTSSGSGLGNMKHSSEESAFEDYFEHNLLNFTQAKAWRTREKSQPVSLTKVSDALSGAVSLKIVIEADGFYKITGDDLRAAGMSLSQIDPGAIRLTNKNREIPIWISGDKDGYFDTGDAVHFRGEFNRGDRSYYSPYTPSNTYWLHFSDGNGLRVVEIDGGLYDTGPRMAASSRMDLHFEEDLLYERLMLVTDEAADHWFWSKLQPGNNNNSTDVELELENPSQNNGFASISVHMRGLTHLYAAPDHHVIAKMNGYLIGEATWDGQDVCTIENANVPNSILLDGANLLTLHMPGDTEAGMYDIVLLDWVEISYDQQLQASHDVFQLSRRKVNGSLANQFTVANFSQHSVFIIDENGRRIANYVAQREGDDYSITFQDNSPIETTYYLFTDDYFRSPKSIELDVPSDLHSTSNEADYLIITHRDFFDSARRLAEYRSAEGLRTILVDVQDVYDEFGSGSMDPSSIREFIKYAYENYRSPALSYVLLIGDCTYGYDKRIARDWKVPTYMPTKMEYTVTWGVLSSDNYFACVRGDDVLPDLYIGRLPVSSVEEAEIVISKIIQYQTNSPVGKWRRKVGLITGTESSANNVFERNADKLQQKYVTHDLEIARLSTDTRSPYSGSTEDLVSLIDQGALLLNFIGHGGGGVFSDEELFEIDDVGLLNNTMKFPVLFSLTCFIGYFDSPGKSSLGEELLRATGKGIVAHFGSAGRARVFGDQILNQELFLAMFSQRMQRIGQITTAGKLGLLGDGFRYPDEAKSFSLLGDPATKISLPQLTVNLELAQASLGSGEQLVVSGSVPGVSDGWVTLEVLNNEDSLLQETTVAVQGGGFGADLLFMTPFVLDAWEGNTGDGYVRAYYWRDEIDGIGAVKFSVNTPFLYDVFVEPATPSHMDSLYIYARAGVSSELAPNGIDDVHCLWRLNTSTTKIDMAEISDGLYRTTTPIRIAGGHTIYYRVVLGYENQSFESAEYRVEISELADILVNEDDLRLTGSSDMAFSLDIKNAGGTDTGPFTAQVYDGNPDNNGVLVGGSVLVANLRAKSDTTIVIPWTGHAGGPHYFYALVDVHENVQEKDETNNRIQKRTYVLTKEEGTNGPISSGDLNFMLEVPGGAIAAHTGLVVKTAPLEQFAASTAQSAEIVPVRLRNGAYGQVYSVVSDDSALTLGENYVVRFYFDVNDTLAAQAASFDRLRLYGWDTQNGLWTAMNAEVHLEEGTVTGSSSVPFTTYGLFVNTDGKPPVITLRFEGQNFVSGDFVPSMPRISAVIEDESPLDIDFRSVDIILDGEKVDDADFVYSTNTESHNMLLLSYTPKLQYGDHSLQIDVFDVHGNKGSELVTFTVSENFNLVSFANHPNPFSTETVIAFTLTADAEELALKVYSTAGRLVRDLSDEIQSHVVGYVEVIWDGRDDHGDSVANGVYYLKLTARKGDEKIETIEKMAKLR